MPVTTASNANMRVSALYYARRMAAKQSHWAKPKPLSFQNKFPQNYKVDFQTGERVGVPKLPDSSHNARQFQALGRFSDTQS